MTDTVHPKNNAIDLPRPADNFPLYDALKRSLEDGGKQGVLTVAHDDRRSPLTIIQGRVVSVINESTSAASVMSLLERSGLIAERDVLRTERAAKRKGIFLEDAILATGMVSEGTLSSTREKLCLEVLMELLMRTDVVVTAVWSVRRGTREMCSLPIPFLLREAQRRATHLPGIRRVVPSKDLVFNKASTESGSPGMERWEDLQLSVAERQVYFFVDGKRTVSDLALATCQSEFNVARSLQSLVELGLVRQSTSQVTGSAGSHALRSVVLRLSSLLVAIGLLLGFTALAINLRMESGSASKRVLEVDPFDAVRASGSRSRLEGAVRLYEMTFGEPPGSFEDLLREHYVLREDRKAAATFSVGDNYLLKEKPVSLPPDLSELEDDAENEW